jgi:hypothetical protein
MTLLCVAVYNHDIGAYHSSHEEFEDAKGAIRIHISKKNRQHNGQKKKYKLDQFIVVLEVVDHASLLQAKFGISMCPSVCPGKFNGSTLQRVKHCNMNDKSVSCTWWSQ